MRCQLSRDYRFESAHSLSKVPASHKCHQLHGHGYLITVILEGEVDPELGWLVDFADIDRQVSPLIAQLDHRVLNEIPGLENPTSELLAGWLWQKIHPKLPSMVELIVAESHSARCIYRGE